MRAVLDRRVSSTEQTKSLSLETQEESCRAYCASNGFDVDRVFVDAGVSAKTADRPAFLELLKYCRAQRGRVHAVVVYSLTRFARNSADHHAIAGLLRGLAIRLKSVTEPIDDSSSGRLMEGILAAMAQWDNDVRSERVTAGIRAAVARGRWVWRAPVGYRTGPGQKGRGPSLLLDETEAPLVRQAFALVAEGRLTGRPLRAHLAALGLRGHEGQPLTLGRIYAMLRHPVYAGRLRATKAGGAIAGDFEALVSPEIFARVQVRLSARGLAIATALHHTNHPDFPLRRFVRCATCQKGLTGSWSKGRSQRYAFYCCLAGCTRVRRGDLEAAFLQLCDGLSPAPYYAALREHVLEQWRLERSVRQEEERSSRATVVSVERKLEVLDRAFIFESKIDHETYLKHRDDLREQLVLARLVAHEAEIEQQDLESLLAFGEHALTHAAAIWTSADTATERARVQATFFPEGLVWRPIARANRQDGTGRVVFQRVRGEFLEPRNLWDFYELGSVRGQLHMMERATGIEPV